MVRCSGIGVEEVQLNFCDALEDFCPSAVPRFGDTERARSNRGLSDSGIGVEEVHLHLGEDFEEFFPSAVPRLGETKVKTPVVDACRSVDEDPVSSSSPTISERKCTNSKLHPAGQGPCVTQLFEQLGAPESEQDGADSRTAFAVNSNILRGVPAGVVVRRGARLLSSAAGSEATYLLSRPVDHLGAFVSHNWSVGRGRKWLTLCLHFHFLDALACGILMAAVLCCASSFGWLPRRSVDVPCVCCVCGSLVFYVVLFFGSDVLPARFLRHPDVFLDKACIHQVDKTLQRQGIESLGGFLYYSWSMVVLYTPVYTTKLWTVYEMACFLSVHPGGRLVWLPVDVPPAVLVLSVLMLLRTLAIVMASSTDVFAVQNVLQPLFDFSAVVCGTFMLHRVVRDQVQSQADLRRFSIRNAVCAVEGDRAIVEGNVASVMRDLKLVPSDSTHEEALLAFDRMVQTAMPRAIRDSVGRARLKYELLFVAVAPALFSCFDVLGAQVFAGASVQAVLTTIVIGVTQTCATLPLGTALAAHLSAAQRCARFTHCSGFTVAVFVVFVSVVSFLCQVIVHGLVSLVWAPASKDLFVFVLLSLVSIALCTLTYVLYRRPAGQRRRRRTGDVSEAVDELAAALGSHLERMEAVCVRRRSPQ